MQQPDNDVLAYIKTMRATSPSLAAIADDFLRSNTPTTDLDDLAGYLHQHLRSLHGILAHIATNSANAVEEVWGECVSEMDLSKGDPCVKHACSRAIVLQEPPSTAAPVDITDDHPLRSRLLGPFDAITPSRYYVVAYLRKAVTLEGAPSRAVFITPAGDMPSALQIGRQLAGEGIYHQVEIHSHVPGVEPNVLRFSFECAPA